MATKSSILTVNVEKHCLLEHILLFYVVKMIPLGQVRLNVSKGANVRNRYNQVPHLTQDTNVKVTSPFLADDHKAHINRRAQRHSKHKTEKNIKDPQ